MISTRGLGRPRRGSLAIFGLGSVSGGVVIEVPGIVGLTAAPVFAVALAAFETGRVDITAVPVFTVDLFAVPASE